MKEINRLKLKPSENEDGHGLLMISDIFFTLDTSLGSELGNIGENERFRIFRKGIKI